ncbi:hypothetical protein C1H46_009605 [Malus baccata]|uniref:Uncharacterized protein n=1 Tax=Malus baccata TaxID=106549 RepID=A0A540N124_MALBA|nr:hypothetical protein C1H46_009605 [Malus baccata]
MLLSLQPQTQCPLSHPTVTSTTVAHTPASTITTCGPFLLHFSPPGEHHQARGGADLDGSERLSVDRSF